AIHILEWMRVDGERTFIAFGKQPAFIHERAGWFFAAGDAQLMFEAFFGDGIVDVKHLAVAGDFGRPKGSALEFWFDFDSATVETPMHQVGRSQHRERQMHRSHLVTGEVGLADGFLFADRAGADRKIFAAMFPDERIGKVIWVNWI